MTPTTGQRVRVLLFLSAPHAPQAVADAYHRVSRALAATPGLLHNSLLEDIDCPGRFIVVSEWASIEAFRAWEEGPDHRAATAPLRPYQDCAGGTTFGIYGVAAEYRA
jgi:heme oxygenase (mycobilin-producing)